MMRQRRPARSPNAIPQRPFGQVPRVYDPIRVLSDDQVEAIHQAALTLLVTQGMRVLNGTAMDYFRRAGARSRGRWSTPTPA
jgi:trimethylamine--corrinoid protein Co-methyltransferase